MRGPFIQDRLAERYLRSFGPNSSKWGGLDSSKSKRFSFRVVTSDEFSPRGLSRPHAEIRRGSRNAMQRPAPPRCVSGPETVANLTNRRLIPSRNDAEIDVTCEIVVERRNENRNDDEHAGVSFIDVLIAPRCVRGPWAGREAS